VVVTDDGSTDDTAAVVQATDPQAKYLWHPNTGSPTTPKNRGFAVSRGRYVGFLDCDDKWIPGAPARAVELLDRYPEVGLVFGDTLIGNEAEGFYSLMGTRDRAAFDAIPHREPEPGFRILDPRAFYERLTVQNQFSVCAAILRRELFTRAGGFTRGMRVADEWGLWLRLCCHTTVGWMDRPIARYYVHPGGMSRDNWDGFDRGFCEALGRALAQADVTPEQRKALRRQYRRQLFDYAYRAFAAGRLCDARRRSGAAVRAGNFRPEALALWVGSHLPAGALRRVRELKKAVAPGDSA
jgi:glycosyltransferase involved in cell wall biosynthesis